MLLPTLLAAIPMAINPNNSELLTQVDSGRLRKTVERLALFNTRNTLSPALAESANWLRDQYSSIPFVKSELFAYTIPAGRRVPEDKQVVQVVAWIDGEGRTASKFEDIGGRVILIGGHMDSLNLQVPAETGRAPGANDDASGTAAALEIARIMAGKGWKQTVVFVGFTGEEQGLHGSRALAKFAKARGWQLEAVLSNDTIGSSSNKAGQKDEKNVRVFSDLAETHNSRELARFIELVVRKNMKDFGVKLVLRADRFGRGGDHTPFAQEGFSAVRFIEVHEEYTRQHTPDDLPEYMDWAYLAQVTKANLAAMAELANAGVAPSDVRIVRDQSHDTTVTWKGEAGTEYVVYWRDTGSPIWQGSMEAGPAGRLTVKGINKDDHIFAVGAKGGVPIEAK